MVHLFEKNGCKNGENDIQTISSETGLLVTCLGYPGKGRKVYTKVTVNILPAETEKCKCLNQDT